jgi:hypothetical protein
MPSALGIQYLQQRGADSLAFGIFDSQSVGARLIGMAADSQLEGGAVPLTVVQHLTDRDDTAHRSGRPELSMRRGRQMGDFNVGLSGRGGALDADDSAYLAKRFATYNGTNRTRLKYGLDATYNRMPFYGTLEYYGGTVGGIRQKGYAILVGVEPSKQCTGIWREWSGACKGLFLRYVNLDIDVPPVPGNTMTYDTEQLAVSYVMPLRCKYLPWAKWLQLEYERNKEDAPPGADQIPNDMFFVELFSAF